MILADIEKDYNEFCKSYPTDYCGRAEKLWNWCKTLIDDGQNDEAWLKSLDAFYYSFLDNRNYNGFEVFSFRVFDENGYALEDIKNGTMSLVHPDMFNDPFDTVLLPWLRLRVKNSKDNTTSRDLACMMLRRADALKARCFVRTSPLNNVDGTAAIKEQQIEKVSPLMWAHYTNSHKGFCIKYTLDNNVVIRDEATHKFLAIEELNYISKIDLTADLLMRDALLVKSEEWKYEHEVRAILFDPNEKKMVTTVKAPKMSAIYLGLRCSSLDRQKMIQALREKNTPLFQMCFDPKDANLLYPERIG